MLSKLFFPYIVGWCPVAWSSKNFLSWCISNLRTKMQRQYQTRLCYNFFDIFLHETIKTNQPLTSLPKIKSCYASYYIKMQLCFTWHIQVIFFYPCGDKSRFLVLQWPQINDRLLFTVPKLISLWFDLLLLDKFCHGTICAFFWNVIFIFDQTFWNEKNQNILFK